MISKN